MLDQETDCSAVLQQIAAIRGAVSGLTAQVLERPLRERSGTEERTPQERQEDLEQVLSVLRSYLKCVGDEAAQFVLYQRADEWAQAI